MNDTSATLNSFSSKATLEAGGEAYAIHRLDSLSGLCDLSKVPYSVKLLLENLLRNEDGRQVSASHLTLEKCEGWGARPLWANQRVGHPPTTSTTPPMSTPLTDALLMTCSDWATGPTQLPTTS